MAHLPDVIVGWEVSASFPGTAVQVHLGVLDIGGIVGLPLLCLPLIGAMMHFIEEARFNGALLFDLVAHPRSAHLARPRLPETA